MKAQPEDCVPNERAFGKFLEWLDEGIDSDGEKYIEIRRRLVSYFERKGCIASDELADETLNRVARRLEEESSINSTSPAQYCYVVARFVFLEYLRRAERRQVSLEDLSTSHQLVSPIGSPSSLNGMRETKEKLDDCLQRCLQKLTPENQKLIQGYYRGERKVKIQHRRDLAAGLGMTINAVSIKACRIRATLEGCVRRCSGDE
jgi:RNA polymerase sigma factor (sigma-70 family)